MNTWRSIVVQFGTPIVLLACLIVAMRQREEWHRMALEWKGRYDNQRALSAQWEQAANEALRTVKEYHTNVDAIARMTLTNSHDIYAIGDSATYSTNALDYWSLQDRSTWQLSVDFDNDGSEALFVYGELVGHIVNCKFIPFQKP